MAQLDGDDLPVYSPVCMLCVHLHYHSLHDLDPGPPPGRCDAFPEGIPPVIWRGDDPHTEAFAGDAGIVFERHQSALRGDVPSFRVVSGWFMAADVEGFLSDLSRSRSLGDTDEARVRAFLKLPAADSMPERLRVSLDRRFGERRLSIDAAEVNREWLKPEAERTPSPKRPSPLRRNRP